MPIFMKFEGIDGDVTAHHYEKWHEALSFSWGESNTATATGGGGGGASAGRVSMSDLNVLVLSGRGTPQLMYACAKGAFIPSVRMDLVMPGGDGSGFAFQRWTLNRVLITSVQLSGSGSEVPLESLSLNYSEIKFEQGIQNSDGFVHYQQFQWDLRSNSGSFTP